MARSGGVNLIPDPRSRPRAPLWPPDGLFAQGRAAGAEPRADGNAVEHGEHPPLEGAGWQVAGARVRTDRRAGMPPDPW